MAKKVSDSSEQASGQVSGQSSNPVGGQSVDAETQELRRQLEATQRQLAENESVKKQLEETQKQLAEMQQRAADAPHGLSAPQGRVSQLHQSNKGKQYDFRVTQTGKVNGRDIRNERIIKACDESEAIRLFCISEEVNGNIEPREVGIDPSRFTFQVAPVDRNERFADARDRFKEGDVPKRMMPAFAH